MTMISCHQHSVSGAVMACKHIRKDVELDKAFAAKEIDYDDLVVPNAFLCEACFEECGECNFSRSEWDDFVMGLEVVCGDCFGALRQV